MMDTSQALSQICIDLQVARVAVWSECISCVWHGALTPVTPETPFPSPRHYMKDTLFYYLQFLWTNCIREHPNYPYYR